MPETDPITSLSSERCAALLGGNALGRLAISVDGHPDIYPVNYAYFHESIFFRTAEGSKLAASVVNPHVAFEIDGYSDSSAWSVVVKGEARILDDDEDDLVTAEAKLNPWVPTIKMNLVGITPTEVSGRLFHLGPPPDLSI